MRRPAPITALALAFVAPAAAGTTVEVRNHSETDLLVIRAADLGATPLGVRAVCLLPGHGGCACAGWPEFGGRLYGEDPVGSRPEFEYVVPAGEARAFTLEDGDGRARLEVRPGPLPGVLKAQGLLVYPYPCLPWAVPAWQAVHTASGGSGLRQ